MRYGIISDIHANLEALEATLEALAKSKIDEYICVGDIVGYGANPRTCIDRIKDLNPITVVGNHDAACVDEVNISYFNENAKLAVLWTRETLNPSSIDYLKALKLIVEKDNRFTVVHGTLKNPEIFNYMIDSVQASSSFNKMNTNILFVGHSHVPGIFEYKKNKVKYFCNKTTKLSLGAKYIVNAGSVGQPRDGDARGSYVIYDTAKNAISIERIEYNVKAAQEKIRKSGLPEFLAYRLGVGI